MHCRVRAGPATLVPGVRAAGPTIWGLRTPSLYSSLLTVALPIERRASARPWRGRSISPVSITTGAGPSVAIFPLRRRRGASLGERPSPRLDLGRDRRSGAGGVVHGQGHVVVLAGVSEGVRGRPLVPGPRRVGPEHGADGDLLVHQPQPEERVAPHHLAVPRQVLGVVAVQVEVVAELVALDGGTHDGAGPGQAQDGVVLDLPVAAPDDDAPGPQLVVPLVVGEVVHAGAAVAEIDEPDEGLGGLDGVVVGPAVPVQRSAI